MGDFPTEGARVQCPNCGKEAINVNGRYVCLDCGVELTPSGAPVSGAPAVDNHAQAPAPAITPINDPNTPPQATITTEPVVPITATVDPMVTNPVSAEPATPSPSPAVEFNAPTPESVPSPDVSMPTQPISAPAAPAEPVRDYFQSQIDQPEASGVNDFSNSTPAPEPASVVPDFPVPEPATAQNVPETLPEASVPVVPEAATEPVSTMPDASAVPDLNSNDLAQPNQNQNVVPETAPSLAESTVPNTESVPAPESYFQPASLDLGVAAAATTEPVNPGAALNLPNDSRKASEPAAVLTEQPAEPTNEVEPPYHEETEIPINVVKPEAPAAPLPPESTDNNPVIDPLDQVSPLPENQAPTPIEPQSNFPGTSTIPSAESVFGAPPTSTEPTMPAKKSKKWLWILLIVLGVLLLLGGGIFAYMAMTGSQSQGQSSQNGSKNILTISSDVGGSMDKSTDLASTFEQTLDFSKAAPADNSQAVFFSKPTDLKETWLVNSTQDISVDATADGTEGKRIYIAADGATYVYSNDAKTWVKTDGQNLSPESIFFPIESRGSLFYLTRVDNLESQGNDTIDGVSVQKIKITPKKETFEELLTSANASFSKINYTDLDTSGLTVTAWVNDQHQVVKVTASGTVQVTADLYTGPVTINSTGTYKYEKQTVTKPA